MSRQVLLLLLQALHDRQGSRHAKTGGDGGGGARQPRLTPGSRRPAAACVHACMQQCMYTQRGYARPQSTPCILHGGLTPTIHNASAPCTVCARAGRCMRGGARGARARGRYATKEIKPMALRLKGPERGQVQWIKSSNRLDSSMKADCGLPGARLLQRAGTAVLAPAAAAAAYSASQGTTRQGMPFWGRARGNRIQGSSGCAARGKKGGAAGEAWHRAASAQPGSLPQPRRAPPPPAGAPGGGCGRGMPAGSSFRPWPAASPGTACGCVLGAGAREQRGASAVGATAATAGRRARQTSPLQPRTWGRPQRGSRRPPWPRRRRPSAPGGRPGGRPRPPTCTRAPGRHPDSRSIECASSVALSMQVCPPTASRAPQAAACLESVSSGWAREACRRVPFLMVCPHSSKSCKGSGRGAQGGALVEAQARGACALLRRRPMQPCRKQNLNKIKGGDPPPKKNTTKHTPAAPRAGSRR